MIDAIRTQAPDALGAGVDLVLAPACDPAGLCASGEEDSTFVLAIPPDWRSLDDVRWLRVSSVRLRLDVAEVVMGSLPARILALVSRASLPLPVSEPPSGDGVQVCMTARLEGGLRGSPWDPRVARVGRTAVRWPAGFAARFVPDLELVGPDGSVVAREGDLMALGGGFGAEEADGFGACSINGVTYPRP